MRVAFIVTSVCLSALGWPAQIHAQAHADDHAQDHAQDHAATVATLYSFKGGAKGAYPESGITVDPSAGTFAITGGGGRFGVGAVIDLLAGDTGKQLWKGQVGLSFQGDASPFTAVIGDGNGHFFGTLADRVRPFGAPGAQGAVYSLTAPTGQQKHWSFAVLHQFRGGNQDGSIAQGSLIRDPAGHLFGTTQEGGAYGVDHGTVFELTPPASGQTAWGEQLIYSFSFTGLADGHGPASSLTLDRAGNLYGVTLKGGQNGFGTVFRLTPPAQGGGAWTETTLYDFLGGAEGVLPCLRTGLSQGPDGTLYGTMAFGGDTGNGTVFSLSPGARQNARWKLDRLYSFDGISGSIPGDNHLLMASDGTLLGTALQGGAHGFGVVFKLSPAHGHWREETVYDFAGGVHPAVPWGDLYPDTDGSFIGTTTNGGRYGFGTVYRLTP